MFKDFETWLIVSVMILVCLFVLFSVYPELDKEVVKELALKGWR